MAKRTKEEVKAAWDGLSAEERTLFLDTIGLKSDGDLLKTIEQLQKDVLELKKGKESKDEGFFERLFG